MLPHYSLEFAPQEVAHRPPSLHFDPCISPFPCARKGKWNTLPGERSFWLPLWWDIANKPNTVLRAPHVRRTVARCLVAFLARKGGSDSIPTHPTNMCVPCP